MGVVYKRNCISGGQSVVRTSLSYKFVQALSDVTIERK